MFALVQGTTRRVRLNVSNSLGYFLIKFSNQYNLDVVYGVFANIGSVLKPIIQVTEIGGYGVPNPLDGEVNLNVIGNWSALIYRQSSATNLDVNLAEYLSTTNVFVQGDSTCVFAPRNTPMIKTCQDVKDCLGIDSDGEATYFLNQQGNWVLVQGGGGGGGTWGSITGTLSNQTDLQSALNAKFDDPSGTTSQYVRGDGSLSTFPSIPSGTVTSVGLTMPTAFSVASSPITSSGTIAVTGAGTTAQYIRGDGTLATLPISSAITFMFSGTASSISTYYQAQELSVYTSGALTTVSQTVTTSETLLASFATNSGYPNQTVIPIGSLLVHYETQKASGGQSYYTRFKIYKRNLAGTETLLLTSDDSTTTSSNSIIQQTITAYNSSPLTLLSTDRLVVKVYAVSLATSPTISILFDDTTNARLELPFNPYSGSFLTSLNGLTTSVQTFAVGTSGTDFAISSATATHTFNLPTASATNRGALSTSDWSTFNSKIGGSGTTNEIAYFSASGTIASLTTGTYPSLTELSYVKGASSNLQSQINAINPVGSKLYLYNNYI